MSRRRLRHPVLDSSDEEQPPTDPIPRKRPRRKPNTRPNNTERLTRLENMLEEILKQKEATSTRQEAGTAASTRSSEVEESGTQGVPQHTGSVQGTFMTLNTTAESNLIPDPVINCLSNNQIPEQSITNNSLSGRVGVGNNITNNSTPPPMVGNNLRFLGKPDNIPKFDGNSNTTSVHTWLHRLESLATIYGWDEKTLIYHMTASLEGNALLWFGHQQDINISWEDWKKRLAEFFPAGRGLAAKLHDFVTTTKQKDEKVLDFYYKKLAQGKLCELSDHMICDVIIYTLNDSLLKAGARGAGCRDTRSLLNYLTDAVVDPISVTDKQTKNSEDSEKGFFRQRKCFVCGRRGHTSYSCRDNLRCTNCSRIGHKTEDCRFSKKCSHCNKVGHERDDCYSLKNAINAKQPTATQTSEKTNDKNKTLYNIRPIDEGDRKYHKTVIANGHNLSGYIDLGSACNTITVNAAKRINLAFNTQCRISIKGYGGQIIAPEGESSLRLCIDGVCENTPVLVVRDDLQDTDMIIGRAFTELPGIFITKTSKALTFSKDDSDLLNSELPFPSDPEVCISKVQLKVPHDTVLEQGLNRIMVYTDDDIATGHIKVCRSEHRSLGKEIDIPEQTVDVFENILCIDVYNFQFDSLTLYSTQCIARGQIQVDNMYDTDLQGDDQVQLHSLLEKFSHCFDDQVRLGKCNVSMKIELTSEVPFYYRPYRMSIKEQEIVRDIISDLINKDIIEPSESPYASPVILVQKKNGDYRMCVDYRQLNRLTKKDRYPLPLIQDQLDRLSTDKWFTKLDLAVGYHQIEMHPDSRKYTAFVTPFGQFQYKRMPFGLANAPAIFQRAMNSMLGQYRFQFAAVYIDDILIFSKSTSEGFDHLERILELISKSGIVLRREKCSFFKTKIEYLGHIISSGEIRPAPDKVKALTDFATPTNTHELRRFIGLASYFRKFVVSFANRIRPLSCLLKKDQLFNWGVDQEAAFCDIKSALISEPVLAIYNPDLETQIHTDASSFGVGGILFQKQANGHLKPVAYFSKQTTATEQKYHSYELEAMAVVMSIRKFRVYLVGRPFTVLTDCQALSTTWTKKDLLPRIGRWWLELQSYDFTVQYRPGVRMQHVDALSRCALPVQHITEENWVLAVQNDDEKLRNIVININSPEYKDLYKVEENILYRKVGEQYKIVIPKSVRWRIVKMFHDDNGHMNENKVIELIQREYWFEKLRRFVSKFIRGCISCQFAKTPTGKRRGFLNPIDKGNIPWQTWHLDHLGPFCISQNKNTYILVIVDAFSKFTWLQPVPDTSTSHVITTMNLLVRIFGLPGRIITDRGKAFTSYQFNDYCKSKQIRHILNAVACPRANGQVERYNRTVLQSLIAYTGENDSDWEKFVPQVERGINTTTNSTTQKSPYELLYGFKPRFEIDLLNRSENVPNLPQLRAQAENNTIESAKKAKDRYDKNRIPSIKYQVGDLVQVQRRVIKKGLTSGKLVDKYAGPYKIVKVFDNDRYRVTSLNKKGRKYNNVIASDKIKKFVVQTISDDELSDS